MRPPLITAADAPAPRRPVRAAVLDLDGTCINLRLEMHPRTEAAIRAAAQRVPVVIATGRMYRSALPWARRLGITEPLVCYQGALVREVAGGSGAAPATLFEQQLSAEIAREVIGIARENHWHVQAYVDDQLLCEQENEEARLYAGIAQVPVILVPNLDDAVAGGSTKVICVDRDPEEMQRCRAVMTERFGPRARVTTSLPQFCEVVDPQVSKSRAIEMVLQRRGLSLADAVACGDGPNDADALAGAALGVAVSSGDPGLISAADALCASPDDGGVADALAAVGLIG